MLPMTKYVYWPDGQVLSEEAQQRYANLISAEYEDGSIDEAALVAEYEGGFITYDQLQAIKAHPGVRFPEEE
jgi:hypothetical protein